MNNFKLSNLIFQFYNQKNYFFDNINITLEPKLTFLKGPNGSGKSTLFKIINGEISACDIKSGTIFINDIDYNLRNPIDRKILSEKIMLIPQNFDEIIANEFTALDNISFVRFSKLPGLKFYKHKDNFSDLLKAINLPLNIPAKFLSGGQRQILSLLMALETNPQILLLDEPTATLDPHNSNNTMLFIKQLIKDRNLIVFCICHDEAIIDKYKDFCLEIKYFEGRRNIVPVP